MSFNMNSQMPGQSDGLALAQSSTTMWTQPETEEQQRYFSKHAPKRRAYGLIMTLLQAVHAFLAFPAWITNFEWALAKFPLLLPAAPWLAVVALTAFHWLFRVTWTTFWYDKLDKDDRTDSSPFLPIVILLVLLWTEKEGAERFLTGQITPPALVATTPVDGDV